MVNPTETARVAPPIVNIDARRVEVIFPDPVTGDDIAIMDAAISALAKLMISKMVKAGRLPPQFAQFK